MLKHLFTFFSHSKYSLGTGTGSGTFNEGTGTFLVLVLLKKTDRSTLHEETIFGACSLC